MRAPRTRRLCRLYEIEDGDARGCETEGDGPDIFVVRKGEEVYGYLNNCPHWGISLDMVPGRFMNHDKGMIQCANHGARFVTETGECTFGPCLGESLSPVRLRVVDGEVMVEE